MALRNWLSGYIQIFSNKNWSITRIVGEVEKEEVCGAAAALWFIEEKMR